MADFNHALARRAAQTANGRYETYGTIDNIVWQTRSAAPSAFEERLADGLEAAFCAGCAELSDVVAHLNRAGIADERGDAWREATLLHVLQRLGQEG